VKGKPYIWIDFENAPHVWVLSPVLESLKQQGYPLLLTARDFSYTVELCRRRGYRVKVVGLSGVGASTAIKVLRTFDRAAKLCGRMVDKRKQIALALSHGSRSQILAARLLDIPIVSLDDYECSDQSLVRFVDHLLVPFPIPRDVWGSNANRVTHYPGLKEELYLCDFEPSSQDPSELRDGGYVYALFRPEGRFAHYGSENSSVLQRAVLNHLASRPHVFLVLLPRDTVQAEALVGFCEKHRVSYWLPDRVLDGPELLWRMDLVLSGGGTMTREAAVLGVPSYSFFAGQWGAVDRHLLAKGKLVRLATDGDARCIKVRKRDRAPVSVRPDAQKFVTDFVHGVITP
jgi:predicted glycosyltransferase